MKKGSIFSSISSNLEVHNINNDFIKTKYFNVFEKELHKKLGRLYNIFKEIRVSDNEILSDECLSHL